MTAALALAADPERILVVRADRIGDHVLAAGMLPLIRARFPGARITVACPAEVQGLFTACPCVDRVVPFVERDLHRSLWYRLRLALALRRERPDLALNTVYSRNSASDLLCRLSGARIRIGHQGDTANLKPDRKRKHDRHYTFLVPSLPAEATELERNQAFSDFLGLSGVVTPAAWLTAEDRGVAAELLVRHGLDRVPCLAFFPGAGNPIRHYPAYPEVLAAFQAETRAGVVCLGGAGDRAWAETLLANLPGPAANLCGATSLPQAAALLERCRLGFGAETGLAHLATAVGTPQLVLLGGGFFGRFMPTSPLTSVVCLPVACYRCAWDCPYERPHCVADLPPGTVREALTRTWRDPDAGTRLFHPAMPPLGAGPARVDPAGRGLARSGTWVPLGPGQASAGERPGASDSGINLL